MFLIPFIGKHFINDMKNFQQSKMILKFFILCLIYGMVNGDYNILDKFNFCHPKDQIIEFDFENDDMINSLNSLKKFDNEYNFIYTLGEPLIVYSMNGIIYTTTCTIIDEIFVPSSFSDCTLDMPVYFFDKHNMKSILYFTKSGVLRNNSEIVECNDEYDIFNFKNKKFISRLNRTAKVFDRKSNITRVLDLIRKKNENESYEGFVEFYYQKFTKNKYFIASRDIFNYIFMVFVIMFGKNKYVTFTQFVFKLLSKKNEIKKLNLTNNKTTIIKLIEGNPDKNVAKLKSLANQEMEVNFATQFNVPMSIQKGCKCTKGCKDKHCPCKRSNKQCFSECHCTLCTNTDENIL